MLVFLVIIKKSAEKPLYYSPEPWIDDKKNHECQYHHPKQAGYDFENFKKQKYRE